MDTGVTVCTLTHDWFARANYQAITTRLALTLICVFVYIRSLRKSSFLVTPGTVQCSDL